MTGEGALLAAIAGDPGDALAWLALADCLEERGGTDREAEVVRLREWLRFADIRDPQYAAKQARLQAALATWRWPQGMGALGPRLSLPLPGGEAMQLVLVPPGVFWMGSPADEPNRYEDEGPRHRVRLTRGFWAGVCPVTQGQWQQVMGKPPENFTDADKPVDQANWHECEELCERLSERTGRACRLPTEAEWEYACRAGTTTRFYSGEDEAALARAAWYAANSGGEARRVGRLVPNAWGLHDMLGGVWEWCGDSQREFADAEAVDPVGSAGHLRVVRGGSRGNDPRATRCAHRGIDALDSRLGPLGCRVVISA